MEDFALDIIIGQGPAARNVSLKMPPFTLIGATTRFSLIGAPLRDRFGSVYRLDFYDFCFFYFRKYIPIFLFCT